ncbi:MAG: glycosyltransferase family 2 protein [Deltaproteobacteria bacterium]|nr:glycosyltransferase family 2 protein [Deltaproteobacteria bacterium]
MSPPLLSICIPTFSRAQRLGVMLDALCPQVVAVGDQVELCISDNASPDETSQVISSAAETCPIRRHRQPENVGVIRNIAHLAWEMARGDWVWMLGDDDLLRPGALGRVVETLRDNQNLDAILLNFEFARFEDQWPNRAPGGYTGPRWEPGADLGCHRLTRWEDALDAGCGLGTPMYMHVVRRALWQGYAENGRLGEPFESPRWTFPHTFMIADAMFGRPSYFVGDPVLVIFNGGQSWLSEVPWVWMEALPGVLSHLRQLGLPQPRARKLARWTDEQIEWVLLDHLQGRCRNPRVSVARFLRTRWREAEAWRIVARASWRFLDGAVKVRLERRWPAALTAVRRIRGRPPRPAPATGGDSR